MAEVNKLNGFLEKRFPKIALVVGIVGICGAIILGREDSTQFFYSYLVSYLFFLTISLGALFFVIIQHLTRAGWSVGLRRIPEHLMANLPLMAVLFIPILLGLHDLYHWSDTVEVLHDALLSKKAPFLNVPFFIVRAVLYFGSWIWLSRFFFKNSTDQDKSGDKGLTLSMQKVSAVAILVYALTQTFSAIDWIMSLTPHWFSTMIGVYIFAGGILAAVCTISLVALMLRQFGYLKETITVEHYHDLGKLIFGFVIFWAYIAFSQYFLIWYANIPEETEWYIHHITGNWNTFAIFVIVFHFVVPFFLFASRHAKRNLKVHAGVVLLLIVMHFLELYWVVMPNFSHHGIHVSTLDFLCFFGLFGIYASVLFFRMGKYALYPIKDPRLKESQDFINH
ncbi:hypothetical protein HOH45_07680 [bacterium]|jgi:hypothetical protein|nr:hypothetical protein [bacterium]